ncbi:MAG: DUF948 domain-containing protein [Streptosporangiaceae bacterium]
MLTGGQLAALIVAIFWAILVCFVAFALVRLVRVLNEAAKLVSGMAERAAPLLDDLNTTVARADAELRRVDAVTRDVEVVSGQAATLSALASVVLTGPAVKAASLTYGVRRAISGRRRRELRSERKVVRG